MEVVGVAVRLYINRRQVAWWKASTPSFEQSSSVDLSGIFYAAKKRREKERETDCFPAAKCLSSFVFEVPKCEVRVVHRGRQPRPPAVKEFTVCLPGRQLRRRRLPSSFLSKDKTVRRRFWFRHVRCKKGAPVCGSSMLSGLPSSVICPAVYRAVFASCKCRFPLSACQK